MKEPSLELDALLQQMKEGGITIKKKSESWFKLGPGYTTTIGKTIYVANSWDKFDDLTRLEILTHEMVHVRQYQKMSVPLFLFLYLLVFFPIGLAFVRYVLERKAYVIGFKKHLEYVRPEYKAGAKQWMVDSATEFMCGKGYGWAWPFRSSVRAYFEREI
jgi:hypothetical protein